jgi:hypothetical protein
MSTLVSLVLAAVLNFVGTEIPSETRTISISENCQIEQSICFNQANVLASTCQLAKNEQLLIVTEFN